MEMYVVGYFIGVFVALVIFLYLAVYSLILSAINKQKIWIVLLAINLLASFFIKMTFILCVVSIIYFIVNRKQKLKKLKKSWYITMWIILISFSLLTAIGASMVKFNLLDESYGRSCNTEQDCVFYSPEGCINKEYGKKYSDVTEDEHC